MDLKIENGYILSSDGTKKTEYHVDLLEPNFTVRVAGVDTGYVTIRSFVDGKDVGTTKIQVIPYASLRIIRNSEPTVDDALSSMMLKIVDQGGRTLTGFNSVATLELPDGAGVFNTRTITIRDGISDPFGYIP